MDLGKLFKPKDAETRLLAPKNPCRFILCYLVLLFSFFFFFCCFVWLVRMIMANLIPVFWVFYIELIKIIEENN